MSQPYEECPRYDRCSVNHCLLDPKKHLRENLEGEKTCDLGKSRRMKIAAKYPSLLPWAGLRIRELATKMRWDAMSLAERTAKKAELASRLQVKSRQTNGEGTL